MFQIFKNAFRINLGEFIFLSDMDTRFIEKRFS